MYVELNHTHLILIQFLIISWLSELKDMNFDFDMALIMIFNYISLSIEKNFKIIFGLWDKTFIASYFSEIL